MKNKITLAFFALVVTMFTMSSYAISPGAGQAQMRNNMQEMQQNKEQMRQREQLQNEESMGQGQQRSDSLIELQTR